MGYNRVGSPKFLIFTPKRSNFTNIVSSQRAILTLNKSKTRKTYTSLSEELLASL